MSTSSSDDSVEQVGSNNEAEAIRPHLVRAQSRRQAVARLLAKNPVLRELYDEGPNRDGKGGWVNAIKDQRTSAYRLIFYLHRLPLASEYKDQEPYEVLFGAV